MAEKNRKLHNQFDNEASTTSSFSASGYTSLKPIFSGVSIFVDGFTVPSSQVNPFSFWLYDSVYLPDC